ncbi:2Fe-2S iron-sulfur cluster-binding protein [Sediminicoccus sp. KRV36]|uniref:2Fe-2S iron-sulfur cluster-binding protein n=1 Tax=Sediminicoccus sp. KRV36 TaxID=3133721 RepID=UPI00201000A9|nr:2Fe-2S iron-sulfur cluster-binding protein [Sediminicoccus rosea]UPY38929.1 2Fe-2S iron-sulfur cluster binding domain-containing protein [Sediminicoccus rosea]
MTAPQLLFYISAALLLQITIGIGLAAWRWQRIGTSPALLPIEVGANVQALAWPGLRDFRVLRRQFEDALRTQCSFYLAPVDGVTLPPFLAGQFLTFAFDIPQPAGGANRPITRCYSVSDAPRPDAYRITVKRVPSPPNRPELPPGVASNHLHDRVQEGDLLRVRAPSGRFFIDADTEVPAVFIAGGIGITPMMSMLAWCLEQQPGRVLHLYYGLRHGGEHAFKTSLEALAAQHPSFHLNVVYSQPGPGDVLGRDHQHAGYIDVALLRETLPHGRHAFYICGPPPMMASLLPALLEWGIAPQDIHHEAFGPASLAPVQAASGEAATTIATAVDIQFRRSGRTLVWGGQDASLLDFAERHGIAVESGCRSGSCGSCETAVVSGTVQYAVKPDHEVAPGRCLLCVGTPGSALVLDA